MREVLERLLAGEFTVEEALRALDAQHVDIAGDLARLDPDRLRRKGVPEVIYAPGKGPAVTADLAARMLETSGQALVSRVDAETDGLLRELARKTGAALLVYGGARRLVRADGPGGPGARAEHGEPGVAERPGGPAEPSGPGGVGILAAGTSDVAVSEEARMVLDGMGIPNHHAYDVGAAALHRLEAPLKEMLAAGVDAFIVAAGMEAALPTVVAGLVAVPVIALPVSTGYGAGGNGLAALLSMLQTCSPGVSVVNIDNGIGAGAAAGLVAARVIAARRIAPTAAASGPR